MKEAAPPHGPKLGWRGRTRALSGGPGGWKKYGALRGPLPHFFHHHPHYTVCVRPRAVWGSMGGLEARGFCGGGTPQNAPSKILWPDKVIALPSTAAARYLFLRSVDFGLHYTV